jgi:hypothetical protein
VLSFNLNAPILTLATIKIIELLLRLSKKSIDYIEIRLALCVHHRAHKVYKESLKPNIEIKKSNLIANYHYTINFLQVRNLMYLIQAY